MKGTMKTTANSRDKSFSKKRQPFEKNCEFHNKAMKAMTHAGIFTDPSYNSTVKFRGLDKAKTNHLGGDPNEQEEDEYINNLQQ